ncbi:type II toxin-antitoxin system RelE/ParE family toxin [Enterococcus casseliflavus]|uniref:type II toxin-antitoxin system RelE/ParE family toxin n=1 Tax=Enterococcus casseliflavus TaxID=37734 RepID=UPI00115E3E3E|nr:type II toxin-antitoxin system RelE/ParE family toxin [Enterococcus casseliflavus]MDB1687147.1 type II toxin-antitoxin system RelE/ParE family toxin [Enterococcus casseliflavus]MDU1982631.1 type II toxin-antitoxin system RelE/ParE family toxin [Enterococcus casseliflavus]MDU5812220.1 type II toxin-antitoxin system RelE/ParE family toxin [Enterococcus casseliflavus]MEB6180138.1 type II toxin-antitoxin system RelE/ParE family toxin [Enterococcus casseliflavus]
MDKPKFEFYERPNGHNEFIEFFEQLPEKDQKKMLAVIANVEEHGILIAQKMKWVKKLGDNLFELRSGMGGNIQRALYFHWLGSKFIITHGFTKKTQKTPIPEIAKAIEIRKEFEEEIKDANS